MLYKKKNWLQIYRLVILVGIFAVLAQFHQTRKIKGRQPIQLSEVKNFFSEAKRLSYTEQGVDVFNHNDDLLGRALSTSPQCEHIKGYIGPSDTLIAIDPNQQILGIAIRSSNDTPGHVEDVASDFEFLESFNQRDFIKMSSISDLEESELWGVSGATRTSDCVSWSVIEKSKLMQKQVKSAKTFQWSKGDLTLLLVITLALIATFTPIKEKPRYRKALRWLIFILVIANGVDLFCLSLLNGWAVNGIETISSLILFMALMLIIPWTTRKQIYCQQICPHGLAQESLEKLIPRRYHWKLSKELKWALKWVPGLLLLLSVIISIFELPADMGNLEVFAAWFPTRASIFCLGLFIASLIFSCFVPKGYCKYACPSGRLLEYMRNKGRADRFGLSDALAALLLLVSIIACFMSKNVEMWLL